VRKALLLIAGLAMLASLALAISACGDDKTTTTSATPSPTEKSQVIDISGNKFNPAEVTVDVGTTVTWSNNDSVTHTVKGANGAINSGDLASGQNFGYTFNEPGTFEYACTIHPDMKGTVTVK